MNQADFLPVTDHYARLAALLSPKDLEDYARIKHVRSEVAYHNRSFVVYEIRNRAPNILDQLTVLDFSCDEADGASTELLSKTLGTKLVVGYKPIRLFTYPIFVHIPLHSKIRWSTTEDRIEGGSLAFDLVIRTVSRLHLQERGIVYCETGVSFAKEFEADVAA